MTIFDDVLNERRRAYEKHGPNSIEAMPFGSPLWLPTLVEEVGEAAAEMTYDHLAGPAALRKELVQVAAVSTAWIEALDNAYPDAAS